jgi:hypothetical protein
VVHAHLGNVYVLEDLLPDGLELQAGRTHHPSPPGWSVSAKLASPHTSTEMIAHTVVSTGNHA